MNRGVIRGSAWQSWWNVQFVERVLAAGVSQLGLPLQNRNLTNADSIRSARNNEYSHDIDSRKVRNTKLGDKVDVAAQAALPIVLYDTSGSFLASQSTPIGSP